MTITSALRAVSIASRRSRSLTSGGVRLTWSCAQMRCSVILTPSD
jgi:hypothetical protein